MEVDGGLAEQLDKRTPAAWLGRYNDAGLLLQFGRLVVTLVTASQREQQISFKKS